MQKYHGLALAEGADGSIRAASGATVTVYDYGLATLAQLFDDDEETALDNPMQTDSHGRYEFNAVTGNYTVRVVKDGVTVNIVKVLLQDSSVADGVETVQLQRTQVAHGFAVNDVVRFNGTIWVKAQADVDTNSEAQGVVVDVQGAAFTLVTVGKAVGLTGLTPGTVYFLSTVTPGGLTSVDPAIAGTAGQISRPVLFALTSSVALVYQARGMRLTNGVFSASGVGYTPEFNSLWSAPLPALVSSAIHQLIKLVPAIGFPMPTLDDALPTGPYTWLDGAEELKLVMSTLYAKWGHKYETAQYGGTAVSDSDLYFRKPDLRGMTLAGADSFGTSRGARSKYAFANKNDSGTQYGEELHSLTSAENGPHDHTEKSSGSSGTGADGGGGSVGEYNRTTGSSGSGTGHNTMQPSALVRWYCRY